MTSRLKTIATKAAEMMNTAPHLGAYIEAVESFSDRKGRRWQVTEEQRVGIEAIDDDGQLIAWAILSEKPLKPEDITAASERVPDGGALTLLIAKGHHKGDLRRRLPKDVRIDEENVVHYHGRRLEEKDLAEWTRTLRNEAHQQIYTPNYEALCEQAKLLETLSQPEHDE